MQSGKQWQPKQVKRVMSERVKVLKKKVTNQQQKPSEEMIFLEWKFHCQKYLQFNCGNTRMSNSGLWGSHFNLLSEHFYTRTRMQFQKFRNALPFKIQGRKLLLSLPTKNELSNGHRMNKSPTNSITSTTSEDEDEDKDDEGNKVSKNTMKSRAYSKSAMRINLYTNQKRYPIVDLMVFDNFRCRGSLSYEEVMQSIDNQKTKTTSIAEIGRLIIQKKMKNTLGLESQTTENLKLVFVHRHLKKWFTLTCFPITWKKFTNYMSKFMRDIGVLSISPTKVVDTDYILTSNDIYQVDQIMNNEILFNKLEYNRRFKENTLKKK